MNIALLPYTHQIGSTHVLISIGVYLKDQGHNVYCFGEGVNMQMAKENGLETYHLEEIPYDLYREKTDQSDLEYLSIDQIKDFVDKELEIYKKHNIDLVISTLRFTARLSTKLAGVKHISINYAILSQYYDLPIQIPESHDLYKYHKFPPIFKLLNYLSGPIKKIIFKKFVRNYNSAAKELGLEKYNNFTEMYDGEITWLYDTREFAPIKNSTPDTYMYLGHVFNSVTDYLPSWYSEVKKIIKENNKKVIFLSMGSSGTIFPKILDKLVYYCNKNDHILIASSCNHKIQTEYSDEPNVFLTNFANSRKMNELADIVVVHGGRGTIYDAFLSGLPIMGIPHQAEQEWNLRRAEDLGLGKWESKVEFNIISFTKKLDDLMNELPKYTENVNRFKEGMEKYKWREVVRSSIENYDEKVSKK